MTCTYNMIKALNVPVARTINTTPKNTLLGH
jgi:hypothetical protein